MLLKRIIFFLLLLVTRVCFSVPANILVVAQNIDGLITLDPAIAYEVISGEYINNTYQRLVSYNPDDPAHPKPEVAARWEITNNGKIYTFFLNRNLKFASGNPITAHDVAYSLTRVIELKKSPSFYLTQFGLNKDRIIVLDDYTISLHLSEPQSENLFLSCLTAPVGAIVDTKIVKSHEKNGDWGSKWLAHNYAGSGPFRLTQWRPNESLIFVSNPYYTKKIAIEKVIVRHVKEPTTQRLLLSKGDVDIARDLVDFENIPVNSYLLTEPKCWIRYVALNQNNKYLKIPEVRQAIKYLIDYDGIAKTILKHKAIVHQSFIPRGFMAATKEMPFKYNVSKAKELLKKVGLEQGFTVLLDVKDLELAQALKSQLAQANITVKIIPGDSKQILSKFRERNFEMIVSTWAPDYNDPHAIAASFLINDSNNIDTDNKTVAWRSNWLIPELSMLTVSASRSINNEQRIKMYYDLQKKFFAQSPIIIMFQEVETAAINKHVTGFTIGPNGDTTSYSSVKKT